jgi:hypothetical protein
MAHAHPPGHSPRNPGELTKDIAAVERSEKAATEAGDYLKPDPDGVGPTLGADLKAPKP